MSILITGAANGLGAALARQSMTQDKAIIGIDHNWLKTDNVSNGRLMRINADLSDLKSLAALSRTISAKGPYKTVIHNAAVSATGRFEDIPTSAHQRLIDINATAPLILTRQLLHQDAIKSGGTIVFIASLSVKVGYPGATSYAASKALIANYAKSLRKALRPEKINVLVVYPGPINTDQAERHAPEGADASKRMTADNVANLIWDAVSQGKKELVPGNGNRFFSLAGTLAPGLFNRAMRKIIYEKLDKAVY